MQPEIPPYWSASEQAAAHAAWCHHHNILIPMFDAAGNQNRWGVTLHPNLPDIYHITDNHYGFDNDCYMVVFIQGNHIARCPNSVLWAIPERQCRCRK